MGVGQNLFSWGDYELESEPFNLSYSVCTDSAGRIYIADYKNHRVQIFDREVQFLDKWDGLHRAYGLYIADYVVYIRPIMTHLDVNMSNPNLRRMHEIYDIQRRRLARLRDALPSEGLVQFMALHHIGIDTRGDSISVRYLIAPI